MQETFVVLQPADGTYLKKQETWPSESPAFGPLNRFTWEFETLELAEAKALEINAGTVGTTKPLN